MLSNDKIQAGLVWYLKSLVAITSELGVEIREDQWQGTQFTYPCLRVDLKVQTPMRGSDCEMSKTTASIIVFTEDTSSKHADRIAGIVENSIDGMSFSDGIINGTIVTKSLVPAKRIDERTWRSEVTIDLIASLVP